MIAITDDQLCKYSRGSQTTYTDGDDDRVPIKAAALLRRTTRDHERAGRERLVYGAPSQPRGPDHADGGELRRSSPRVTVTISVPSTWTSTGRAWPGGPGGQNAAIRICCKNG